MSYSPSLQRDWTYRSGRSHVRRRERVKDFLFRLRPAPRSRVLRTAMPASFWTLYFMFLPDGSITPAHRFTLARLRAMDRRLLIVCAAPSPEAVPGELADLADALIWKALSGYDFSAYAVGLRHLARKSPHADVLVLNDSILGPFADIETLLERAPWDLTGLTSSSHQENHIQSYAFRMRDVTPARLRGLWPVLLPGLAFNDLTTVIRNQELRFARTAARHMSVGSLWHSPDLIAENDPTIFNAEMLLDQGFPFIKKSALGKKRWMIGDGAAERLEKRLAGFGHPAPQL